MAVYVIWDWWKIGNVYFCLVFKDNILYFSQAEIPENSQGINNG